MPETKTNHTRRAECIHKTAGAAVELCLITGWQQLKDTPFRCACETPPRCPRLPWSPRSAPVRVSSRARGEHTLRCIATRCIATRCGATRCGATRCGAMRYDAMQCGNAELACVKIAWKMACERELSSFMIVDAAAAVSTTKRCVKLGV
jgi:hypothetical protein